EEVLEELGSDVFVDRILPCKLEGDGEHIQRVHPHPGGAIRLLEMPTSGQHGAAIKDTDIVQAEETTLENVVAITILAIDPPGEVEQQLVKDAFQKSAIGASSQALFDLVDTPGGPGAHRRIDIPKRPFIGG